MKYSSKNYGKGFRRCKRYSAYISAWQRYLMNSVYEKPKGINKILVIINQYRYITGL